MHQTKGLFFQVGGGRDDLLTEEKIVELKLKRSIYKIQQAIWDGSPFCTSFRILIFLAPVCASPSVDLPNQR